MPFLDLFKASRSEIWCLMADLMDVFDRMLRRNKNPLNPVQQLPQAQIQSVIHVPITDVSMLLAGGRGCWYALAFLVIAAMAGEWRGLHWRTGLQSSKASLAHRGP